MTATYEKPTASSLERAYECPTSCAIAVRVRSHGVHADRGNELHGYVEAVLAGHASKDAALAAVPSEWRQTAADLDWDALLDGYDRKTLGCEVAYAIDVTTGNVRELGRSLARAYPATAATELTGTVDLIGTLARCRRPCVTDLKTGMPTTACEDNWQMRFAAYAVHAATGAPEVVARLAYLAEDGGVRLDEHTFDAFDLTTFPADLLGLLSRLDKAAADVEAGRIVVSDGEHCKYCPAFASCPAKVGIVRQLVPEIAAMHDGAESLAHLTPQQVGVAWARFKELAPMVKKIDAALKEYVRAHPGEVVLPDGRIIAEYEKGRTSINGERAMALAREYGATQEEQQSCMRRAEWTELRACKPKVEKPPAKKRAAKTKALTPAAAGVMAEAIEAALDDGLVQPFLKEGEVT